MIQMSKTCRSEVKHENQETELNRLGMDEMI